jgi:hypothetical protein
MPNRPYNPKQGRLLPYAIRPLPPERAAAMAAMVIEVAHDDERAASDGPTSDARPA